MSTAWAVVLGFLSGVLFVGGMVLHTLMRYVSTDLEGFRRWLDTQGAL